LHIWVDQICINQSDSDEKGQQIPLMKDIYTGAEETIARMGEPSSATDIEQAIGYLDRVGRRLQALGFTHQTKELYSQLLANDEIEALGLVKISDETHAMRTGITKMMEDEGLWHELSELRALDVFFDMSYFQRGWIKQEVALPKHLTFRCGEYTIDADTLYAGIQFYEIHRHRARQLSWQQDIGDLPNADIRNILLSERPEYDAANATLFQQTKYYYDRDGPANKLGGILRKFVPTPNFTVPKDRICGFLGLASDTVSLNIPIACGDEVSAEEIYIFATKQSIKAGDIDFLLRAYGPMNTGELPSEADSLLSWVPDFRNMPWRRLIIDRALSSGKSFTAGTSHPYTLYTLPTHIQESAGPRELVLEGIILDEIGLLGNLWDQVPGESLQAGVLAAYEPFTNLRHLIRVSHMVLEQNPSHPLWVNDQEKARRMEAFWRVPISDYEKISSTQWNSQRATEQRSKQGYEEVCRLLEVAHQIFVNGELYAMNLDDNNKRQLEGLEGDELYKRHAELLCEAINPGELGENYFGSLGLLETRRGFLCGTGFVGFGPVTMQVGDFVCVIFGAQFPVVLRPLGNDRYLFIGEVYCDGVMDGEALQWGIEKRAFCLC
jgi:hypothetical protein